MITGMTKEEIQSWIAALRSGKYQQTRGTLCELFDDGSKGYCCLGVFLKAVDGRILDANKRRWQGIIDGGNGYERFHDFQIFYGDSYIDEDTCISWNDAKELTFEEIADNLEKALEAQNDD